MIREAIEGLRDWLSSDEALYIGSMDGDTLDALAERIVTHQMQGREPTIDRLSQVTCDECGLPAEFTITAAYDLDRSQVHPTVACYPLPMIRACRAHLLERLDREIGTPFATTQYLLTVRQIVEQTEGEAP